MNKFFRALIAGYGAKKLGGGCFSTIIIFFVIYYLLGNCNSNATPERRTGMQEQVIKKNAAAPMEQPRPAPRLLFVTAQ
ncbi:MAG: hypothetical protein QM791_09390 [Ferruginibacter sp.]